MNMTKKKLLLYHKHRNIYVVGIPMCMWERERGGRCGGEELERDVCMG